MLLVQESLKSLTEVYCQHTVPGITIRLLPLLRRNKSTFQARAPTPSQTDKYLHDWTNPVPANFRTIYAKAQLTGKPL